MKKPKKPKVVKKPKKEPPTYIESTQCFVRLNNGGIYQVALDKERGRTIQATLSILFGGAIKLLPEDFRDHFSWELKKIEREIKKRKKI